METLKQKLDREFLRHTDRMIKELNDFVYTKKNMKLNKKSDNVVLEHYKLHLKSSNIADGCARLRSRFLFDVRYALKRKYTNILQELNLSEQLTLINECELTQTSVDTEDQNNINLEDLIYELIEDVRISELSERYIIERVSEEKLELLDKISDYKKKLHENMTKSQRYKKMIDKKYQIYRGAILKSLNNVAKEIGVNHSLHESELQQYLDEYKKGFRHEIKILI